MLDVTSDISHFCEHGFYDWFMISNDPIQYSDENPVLDRYFGPAIGVGPSVMANIMKGNSEVLHCSTYCG